MRRAVVGAVVLVLGFLLLLIVNREVGGASDRVWGVLTLGVIALGLLLILRSDPISRRLFPARTHPTRSALVVLASAASLAAVGWWLLVQPYPARIEFVGATTAAEHPPGISVAGIPWRSPYSELRLRITNPTARAFEHLDLLIKPDQLIAAIRQDGTVPGVSLSPEVETTLIVELEKKAGDHYALPLALVATGGGYRVRCSRLPGRTTLQLVLATVTMPLQGVADTPADDPFDKAFRVRFDSGNDVYWYGHPDAPDAVFGPRAAPATVAISGSYVVARQTHAVDVQLEVREEQGSGAGHAASPRRGVTALTADVVIIGGGVTGTSIAFHLATSSEHHWRRRRTPSGSTARTLRAPSVPGRGPARRLTP